MMKNFQIDNLILTGIFYPGLNVGLKKQEIEGKLSVKFEVADIETPDLNLYYVQMDGIILALLFDQNDICFEINFNIEENKEINFSTKIAEYLMKKLHLKS